MPANAGMHCGGGCCCQGGNETEPGRGTCGSKKRFWTGQSLARSRLAGTCNSKAAPTRFSFLAGIRLLDRSLPTLAPSARA
jgi:hypothetical protein